MPACSVTGPARHFFSLACRWRKFERAQLLLVATTLAGLTSCASLGPPLPPSLELPHPPADLHATRKGDKVTLTWTVPARTMQRQTVRYLGKTQICRSADPASIDCSKPVGELAPPDLKDRKAGQMTATYTDTLPHDLQLHNPYGSAAYAVQVLNLNGRSAGLSNQVRIPLAEALPPPQHFNAEVTARGIEISWTGEPLSIPVDSPVRRSYRVFRRAEGSQQEALVGERMAGLEINMSLIDQSFEWEKTYFYHADTLTVVSPPGKAEVRVEGDDTPEIKVFAHDVFPPATPSGLQAVFSGPGQQPFIDLIWAPVTDSDLEGYNVYRHEEGGTGVKLNAEPVKTPAFRDMQVVAGKTYFYSVSAVDQRGNESPKSPEASETVPRQD